MTIVFFILAALLIASAIGVVASRSPIHSVLWLFINLLSIASFYAILHAHFLALVQIIVYAGAIVVLVLFVIMLLNIRAEESRKLGVPIVVGGTVVALAILFLALPGISDAFSAFKRTGSTIEGGVKEIGLLLYTKYVFVFEVSGVLLLAATIAAVMLARRRPK